jgi:hypothetical protein
MSVWLIGLGAGMTYVLMKQQTIHGTIARAEREYEARHKQGPADGGVSVGVLDAINKKDVRKPAAEAPANTELSKSEQAALNKAGDGFEQDELAYDKQQGDVGVIEPIYMEQHVPQI